MEGSEFDELLDALPLHLRNKVLDSGGRSDLAKRYKKPSNLWLLFQLAVLSIWTVPLTVVGAVLCIPIVTIPFGVAVIALGCYPMSLVIIRYSVKKQRYHDSKEG